MRGSSSIGSLSAVKPQAMIFMFCSHFSIDIRLFYVNLSKTFPARIPHKMAIMKQPKLTEFAILREKTGFTVDEIADRLGISKRTAYRWERGDTLPGKTVYPMLKKLVGHSTNVIPFKSPSFNFIDLFAGIGGMRLGFESIGGTCVFTSEWDMSCRKTYQANFECAEHPFAGDITKITNLDDIPAHDVLLAGFPCQPFSIAGVSKKNALGREHGFKDPTQGTLFFDIVRIIKHHQPSAFLLENVKNLMSHDKGNTFRVICRKLEDELGYIIHHDIINGKAFTPQNRQRIYIVGFKKKNNFSFSNIKIPDIANGPRLSAILHPENGSEEEEPPFTTGSKAKVSSKYTLTDHLWKYLQNYAKKHQAKGNGFGFGLVGPNDTARTLSARYYKDGSEILIRQRGKSPRRLTPRECARLMGFDGPGKKPFEIPVSDTQAYKQFGNAVVVPVIEAIAKAMRPYILATSNSASKTKKVDFAESPEEIKKKKRAGGRG
jgi:DNA (cytosine-5)-methyltransferase 1